MPTDNISSLSSFLENRHTSIETTFTGRKGISYDWQQLLVPSDAVFEATLQTMLNAEVNSLDAGDQMSPTASK